MRSPLRDLLFPTLRAIDALGGSGTKDEVDTGVIDSMHLSDEQIQVEYPADAKAKGSKVLHRLAFARSSLKLCDALDNSTRGVWSLTPAGQVLLKGGDQAARDADSLMRKGLREIRERRRLAVVAADVTDNEAVLVEDEVTEISPESDDANWEAQLLQILQRMPSGGFERLSARLLREVGFARVEVLGRSGDGGLDGRGLLEVALLSFPVFFQCKRYDGQVGPGHIRDFRGAMVGRGDKGLFITTGTFTPAARDEAQRPGAPPIDLIDGPRLCQLLKNAKLGVSVEFVEKVAVNEGFFSAL